MYKCPHCGEMTITLRQKYLASLVSPVICPRCNACSLPGWSASFFIGVANQIGLWCVFLGIIWYGRIWLLILLPLIFCFVQLIAIHFSSLIPLFENGVKLAKRKLLLASVLIIVLIVLIVLIILLGLYSLR